MSDLDFTICCTVTFFSKKRRTPPLNKQQIYFYLFVNSSRVISTWDGDRLVGLIRVMDDRKNAPFYEKHGFKIKENSLPMQYRNVPKYTKS